MLAKRPLIIDTDPGIDDAVAIALAIYSGAFDIKLISCVAGNVGVEATTENMLKLLAYFGKSIPVAKGASAPLIRDLEDASDVHGKSGMEGFEFPEPKYSCLLEDHAVIAMKNVLVDADEPVTIMPIGPLTNIALLLRMYPEVKKNIKEIVMMGGSITRGNKGPMAEFNMYIDPEAAKIVLNSGLKITMATLDAGLGTIIPPKETSKLPSFGRVGKMSHDLFQAHRKRSFGTGLKMYDSCAVAALLQPTIFDFEDCFVDVSLSDSLTYGETVCDLKGYLGKDANVRVTTGVHKDEFLSWFMEGMKKCD